MALEPGTARMIRVRARVYATLRRYLPDLPLGESTPIDLPPQSTIADLLDRLGIPRGATKTCFVNGLQRELDYRLREGDDVALFPPIAGGNGPHWVGIKKSLTVQGTPPCYTAWLP